MSAVAVNHDEVVEQLRDGGLDVGSLEVGRLVRCRLIDDTSRQRVGWYILHELRLTGGDEILVGAWGNWREGTDSQGKPVAHRIDFRDRSKKLSADEKAAIRQRVAEDRRQAERARAAQASRAARRAEKMWQRLDASGRCAYLESKGIAAHGVRFTPRGNMAIPLLDAAGRVHGLQIIYGDPEDRKRKRRDKDFWPAGLAKRGHFFLLGSPSWLILLAEGYATAASLHEATGFPVAVAFDCGNLMPVAQAVRKQYRDARILVCADDDYRTDGNPGMTAASQVALAVGGAWTAPVFTDRGQKKLTDYNDLHQVEGLHVVRAQVEQRLRELKWRSGEASAAQGTAGESGERPFAFNLNKLLDQYTLIYGTETVFDRPHRRIIGLSALRAAAGKSLVRQWLEDPFRQTVLPEQVIFDPTRGDEADICNLWGGWPTLPKSGSCERLLELLEFLVSSEDNPAEAYRWILSWLAYPIQHPGSKMQTALLMHGPEGSGKNTFFAAVRKIYAQHGGIFTQTELESQFNGWTSGKLFMIGNEVVSRMELYHQQGRLKNLITEPEIQINEKNMPVRLEQNHCNFTFFSNRIDIAKLDRDDRRYCVIWTPEPLSEEFYREVAEEMAAGGSEALHDYLVNLDLGDFGPHTKPPVTRSKRELQELSMDSTERFLRDWLAGGLPVPVVAVETVDLYRAYAFWSRQEGLTRAAPRNVFLAATSKKSELPRRRFWVMDRQSKRLATMIVPRSVEDPIDASLLAWATDQTTSFRHAITDWKEAVSNG